MMTAKQHIETANEIARLIPRTYSREMKQQRKLKVLRHLKKACRLKQL